MAQSLLVQQLLQQMLAGNQQMLSPLAPVGKMALAAALKQQQKKQESKDAAQALKIADVLQQTPQLSVAQPGQPAPGLGAPANPAAVQGAFSQNKSLRDVLGGDPDLARALFAKQVESSLGGGESYTLGPDQVRYGADGRVIAEGPKKSSETKPQSSRAKIIQDFKKGMFGDPDSEEARAQYQAALDADEKRGSSNIEIKMPGELTPTNQTNVNQDIMDNRLLMSDLEDIDIDQAAQSLTFGGRLKSGGLALIDKMNMATPEQKAWLNADQKFKSDTERAFLKIRKSATGAQAVLAELADLRKATLDATGNQSPEQYKASMATYKDSINRALKLQNKFLLRGVTDPDQLGLLMDESWALEKEKDVAAEKARKALLSGQPQ